MCNTIQHFYLEASSRCNYYSDSLHHYTPELFRLRPAGGDILSVSLYFITEKSITFQLFLEVSLSVLDTAHSDSVGNYG